MISPQSEGKCDATAAAIVDHPLDPFGVSVQPLQHMLALRHDI